MKKPKDTFELAAAVLESENSYDVIDKQSNQLVNLAIGMKRYAIGQDKEGTMVKECIGEAYMIIMGLLLWFEVDPDKTFNELVEKHKNVLQ